MRHIRHLWAYALAVPAAWYLIRLSGSDSPEQQWVWLEVVLIPLAMLLSSDTFVGRYERGELEPLLARKTARLLFLGLVVPELGVLTLATMLVSVGMGAGGILEGAARVFLLAGVLHLLLVLSRSRWFGVSLFCLWWLFGLVYMTDWADASDAVALWHPMRLSGGGAVDPMQEGAALLTGLLLFAVAWFVVGKDDKWLG
jgi:hypothetical protein